MEPPKIWRERRQRYLALGILCQNCREKSYPITEYCPHCSSEDLEEIKIAREGKILHFTKVSQTAESMMFNTPYIVGLIELNDGIRITGQITDSRYEDLKEGMKIRMVFRVLSKDGKEGLIGYGYKFVPI